MTRLHRRFGVAVGILAASGVVLLLAPAERVTVTALSELPLYDPSTLAGSYGTKPFVVGTLKHGEKKSVSGCNPRKSDIDLEVVYEGHTAVVGGDSGDFELTRQSAYFWQTGAIISCHGLFKLKSNGT